ncbi:hypothetical protein Dimus_026567 [Dionaea muscipula]
MLMSNPRLPTPSLFPAAAAAPRKGVVEPIFPTDTVNSSQSNGGKAGPSSSWTPSLMRISSAK